ncbi:hypothetical protein NMG60_11030688 [Bertholletia excelsa]
MAEANKVKWQEVGGREEEGEMKPWEQHSAVISIPRFDYNAASALLHRSHSGFLVTCPIKREKSATKEAISILKKFTGFFDTSSSECLEGTDSDITAKRRKICREEIDGECLSIIESKNTTASRDTDGGKLSEDACSSCAKSDPNVEKTPILSLVKMTRSGLLLFTIPRNDSPDVVSIVSNIFCSLESRSLSPSLWCHRIFPIQATCCLNEKELHAVVSKLVIQFVNDRQNNLQRPLKFAVGYNRRGIEETQMKMSRNTPKDCEELALLDRNKCFVCGGCSS